MANLFKLITKRITKGCYQFTLLFLLIIPNVSFGTHISGAEISYRWISGNTYELTLTLYRDCAGVAAPTNAQIKYSSSSCHKHNQNVTLNLIPGTGQEITHPCSTATTTCNGGTLTGIQEYKYSATVTLSAQCNDWVFGYDICCRNCAITTLSFAGCANAPATYVEATLNNLYAPSNSSPFFSNIPISFVCIGQPFRYNHGAIDANGDSLVYSLINPREAAGSNINYVAGYSYNSPVASSPAMTINSINGDISMTPTTSEVSVMAVLVKEYRNGVLIGTIVRDMEIWVMPCNNMLPTATGINQTNNFSLNACAGAPINFNIGSGDANAAQIVDMSWNYGIPFATFTTSTGFRPTGQFSWTPVIADARPQPYTFTVTVQDNNCPVSGYQTYSYSISVSAVDVTATSTPSGCALPGTGTATALTTGTGPFSYQWSPGGSTSSTLSALTPGNYTVIATEPNGCSAATTVTVAAPVSVNATVAASSNISCNGAHDGSIAINVNGGLAPYTYSWSPSAGNSASATGLASGTYNITVTDANSCAGTVQVTLTQPSVLNATSTAVAALCNGSNSGTATIAPSGGTAPFTYYWSPGGNTTSSVSGLSAGNYSVIITDAKGCTKNATLAISQPQPLSLSVSGTGSTCNTANGSATASIIGGVGPYSYLWSTGNTTSSVGGLAAGAYSISITDANGCTATDAAAISNLSGPVLSVASVNHLNCNGDNNGSATIAVNSGVNPLTYQWSPTGGTAVTANGLSAGTYTITVRDGNNCLSALSVDITEPAPINIAVTPHNPSCFGSNNGSITTNTTGGTSPYSYSWSPGNAAALSMSNATSGTYQVTMTDSKGCTKTASTTLSQPSQISGAVASVTQVTCNGNYNGSATVSVNGGTSPYDYSWSPMGGNMITASGLSAGNYSVIVTDANNCTTIIPVNISQPLPLSSAFSVSPILCNGSASGSASVNVTGGTGPFGYVWSPAITTTTTAANLSPGTYSVIVTDAKSCTTSASTTINEPASITSSVLSVNNITCFGSNNGSASISASGGVGPYSYNWTPSGGNSSSGSGLTAGLYTITITDHNQCSVSTIISINEPSELLDSSSFTNVLCNGQSNGSIFCAAYGGTAPYTYLWDNGDTVTSRTQIQSGNYSVTITDAAGCTINQQFNIAEPSPLTITPAVSPSTCGNANGTANAIANGGTAPYSYLWNQSGDTTAMISGLNAASYSVEITDAHGCSSTATMNVTAQSGPQLSISSFTNVNCFNGNNGSATVAVTGGTGPLQYQWSPSGGNAATATGLTAGIYSISVTDGSNCMATTSVTITQPSLLTATAGSVVSVNCFGAHNGQASIAVAGGTSPYQYLWSPTNQTVPSVSGLGAGNYNVSVTDANGCNQNLPINISQPSQMLSNTTTIDVSCFGDNTGSASVNVSGGVAPYNYSWNPGGNNSQSCSSLTAGNYDVTITDNYGCTTTTQLSIGQPSAISDSSVSNPTPCGQSLGSATLFVAGGSPPYNYLWTPGGMNSPSVSNLSAGSYTVIITDSKNCSKTTSVGVSNLNGPTLSLASVTPVNCNGGNDGTATVNATGSAGIIAYQWSPSGGSSASANNLAAGNYTVQVTDANQCVSSIPLIITEPPALSISTTTTPALCFGTSSGNASATVTGGVSPYQYNWSNGISASIANNLTSGNYTATITDSHGCSSTVSINISEPADISLSSSTTLASCNGQDGSASVVASGGTPSYNYQWSSGSTLPSATSLMAGNYTVIVTDANGCTSSIQALVSENSGMTLTTSVTDATCFGIANGSASVQVTGGVFPLTYDWSPLSGNSSTINSLGAGTFTISVHDANGCTSLTTITINEPLQIIANIVTQSVNCFGSADGRADANISGGTGPYTCSWSNGSSNSFATNLSSGNYSVIVTDAFGCTTTADAMINTPAELFLAQILPDTICIGQHAILLASASGGTTPYNYSWSSGSQTNQNTVSPVVSTNYNLTVSDANGCSTSTNTLVPVHQPLLLLPSANSVICEGEIATLTIQATGGNGGPYSYTWNNGMTSMPISVSPIQTTNYTVNVTDGCTALPASAIVPVLVNPKPNISFMPSPVSGCTPVIANFTDQSSSNNSAFTYPWNFGDGTTSNTRNGSHTYTQPGDYTVTHTVTDNLGCSASMVVNAAVHVYPFPIADFSFSPDKNISYITPVSFSNESTNAAHWKWNFGDGSGISNAENPTYTYSDTGEYKISLISISDKGCSDTTFKIIKVEGEYSIYIPNAFTPNSDNTNDGFIPKATGLTEFNMFIYDRWGLLLYQTDNLDSPWNGKVNGRGTDCQNDAYVYKIMAKDNLMKMHEFIGRVTLVR